MGIFNRINLTKFSNLLDAYIPVEKMESSWINSQVKLDRLIFANFTQARLFLTNLPGSAWIQETKKVYPAECEGHCDRERENQETNPLFIEFSKENQEDNEESAKVNIPSILCSVDSAYNLQGILNSLGSYQNQIKLEILCNDSSQDLNNLELLLQDKIDEYVLITPPHCSLIHPTYEIDFTNSEKRTKKRTHKINTNFAKLLKGAKSEWYPAIEGTEYYGKQVILSYIQLHLNQPKALIKKIYPPRPMRYYDLLEQEGEIEVRFHNYIPLALFHNWLAHLQKAIHTTELNPKMLHATFLYDAWQRDEFYKNAGKDRFIFTWNDVEFGLQQENFSALKTFLDPSFTKTFSGYYFELSPLIEENDFRIELIKNNFETIPEMQ